MSRHSRRVLAMVTALCLAGPASAQSEDQSNFVLPSGEVPDEIFGVPCKFEAASASLAARLSCMPENPLEKPGITVSVVDSECQRSSEEMMERRRNGVNDRSPFFQVVFESPFTPEAVPDVKGYTGLYRVQLGGRYWWETCGDGRLTRVSAIMFSDTKFVRLKFDVEEKVFGVPKPDIPESQELSQ